MNPNRRDVYGAPLPTARPVRTGCAFNITRLGRTRFQKTKGFTVIEAVVTVALIGVLAAIALPSFREFIAARSVSAHVSDFSATLRLARTEAIKRGTNVVVCRTNNPDAASPTCASSGSDWSTGWLVMVDRGGSGDVLIRVQQAYSNSGGITRNSGNNKITLTPTGLLELSVASSFVFRPKLSPSSSAYIDLTRTVCVARTGSTRLC